MNVEQIIVQEQIIRLKDIIKLNFNDLKVERILDYKDDFTRMQFLFSYKFEHVSLYFPRLEQAGEKAKVLFDLTESEIRNIDDYGEGMYIVYTDLFEITLPDALVKKEISIHSNNNSDIIFNAENELVKALEGIEEMYLGGLISIKERENQKNSQYKLAFNKMIFTNKWRVD